MLFLLTRSKVHFAILFFLLGSAPAYAVDLDFWHPLGLLVQAYRSHPDEKKVVHITSDAMEGWTDVLLEVNAQSGVKAFRLVTSGGASIEFDGQKIKEGAVLKTDQGVNGEVLHTMTLQSDSFDSISGGDLKLIYMVSGVPFFHQFAEFEMRLRPNSSGQWMFESGNDGKPFNSMFLRGNHVFGKLVGISSVEVSWDDRVRYFRDAISNQFRD
jgi:hypothetical protein